ncbi:MAG: NADH-quinone oxidoreductase subunit N [Opitutus sp.]
MNVDYSELFRALRPETSLLIGALLMLGLDLTVFRQRSSADRMRLAAFIGALATVTAMIHVWSFGARGATFGQVFMFDAVAVVARLGLLALLLLTLCLVTAARCPRHPVEYLAILLFATMGFLLMAVAQQLLLAFLALELASLSLYVLAGYDKKRAASAEAALKYFLFGGMAAAFLLFGFSLIYGLTGSIELPHIASSLAAQAQSPLLSVALVMVLIAFGFKSAAAPFHLWAPDVYEGAPTLSAALVASASKLAGFTLFYRLLWSGLGGAAGSVSSGVGSPGWLPAAAVVSLLSLLLGNIGALAQGNVRRLFAYSAIAHAGALLLGVMAAGRSGPAPLLYYATTYAFATVGVFGVIAMIERTGPCDKVTDLAGLYRRSPVLAGCLAVFVLSLAGIPPLAGFFGKFVVFAAALKLGGVAGPAGWLTFLAIALSAVALYYYLLVLKQALVTEPAADRSARIATPAVAVFALLGAAAVLVVLGIWPSLLLGRI